MRGFHEAMFGIPDNEKYHKMVASPAKIVDRIQTIGSIIQCDRPMRPLCDSAHYSITNENQICGH